MVGGQHDETRARKIASLLTVLGLSNNNNNNNNNTTTVELLWHGRLAAQIHPTKKKGIKKSPSRARRFCLALPESLDFNLRLGRFFGRAVVVGVGVIGPMPLRTPAEGQTCTVK